MRLVSVGSGDEDAQQRAARLRHISRRMSPPDNELPGVVPISTVLGRTDDLVVALTTVRVFSNGISLSISARLRRGDGSDGPGRHGLFEDIHGYHRGRQASPQFLLGVAYPDGRTATNFADRMSAFTSTEDDDTPLLVSAGGGGDDRSVDTSFWLWPLPSEGDLTVICAWPARGITETRTVIRAEALAAASADLQVLWPWQPPEDDTPPDNPPPPDLPDGWFKQTTEGES